MVQTGQNFEGFTLVFYYMPEDNDELSTPNAFLVKNQADKITLKQIVEMFPMEGDLHFRFKYSHDGVAVWLDVQNMKVPVPRYKDKIIMKVTRKEAKDLMEISKSVNEGVQNNPPTKQFDLLGI